MDAGLRCLQSPHPEAGSVIVWWRDPYGVNSLTVSSRARLTSFLEQLPGSSSCAANCRIADKALWDTYGNLDRRDCSLAIFPGRSAIADSGKMNVVVRATWLARSKTFELATRTKNKRCSVCRCQCYSTRPHTCKKQCCDRNSGLVFQHSHGNHDGKGAEAPPAHDTMTSQNGITSWHYMCVVSCCSTK